VENRAGSGAGPAPEKTLSVFEPPAAETMGNLKGRKESLKQNLPGGGGLARVAGADGSSGFGTKEKEGWPPLKKNGAGKKEGDSCPGGFKGRGNILSSPPDCKGET